MAPDVKAGDRILFGKYSVSEVKLGNEAHLNPARGRHPRGARRVTGRIGVSTVTKSSVN
jgi:hypothetical protein